MTALPPLASVPDFIDRLGRDLDDNEQARVRRLLVDASANVRGYTRQRVTRETSTKQVTPFAGERVAAGHVWPAFARLPQRPVNAVTTVVDATSGDPVTFAWVGGPLVYVRARGPVLVTYDHGFDGDNDEIGVLDAISALICQVVGRALGVKPDETATVSESTDGYSTTMSSAGAAGAFGMLDEERDALDNLLGRSRGHSLRLA